MSSFVRRATSLAQIQSQSASITQRRGLAGAAGHHGAAKVNFWQQPMNPGNWKEEHFVLISLSGWGLLFYSGYKLFTGDKKEVYLCSISTLICCIILSSASYLFLYIKVKPNSFVC